MPETEDMALNAKLKTYDDDSKHRNYGHMMMALNAKLRKDGGSECPN